MPRSLLVSLAGYAMITAGAVWMFGPVGLLVCGAVLLIAGLLIDLEAV